MIADVALYGLLVVVIVAYIPINCQAGNSYPTPLPDEAHFLWQAHSVTTDNTLFSEKLNTDRTIMWQPPGYLIFIGIILKVVGPSLESGRQISLFLLIGWNYQSSRIVNLFDYYDSLNFHSLNLKGERAYLTPDDRKKLTGILDSLATEKGDLLVEFAPHDDAFYFLNLEERGVKFSCPLFQSGKPDLQIVHLSQHLPS